LERFAAGIDGCARNSEKPDMNYRKLESLWSGTRITHDPDAATAATSRVPIGPLVRTMFSLFDSRGLSWVVLRNSDDLPDFTRHDIDVLVAPPDFDLAEKLVLEAAASHGWRRVARFEKVKYCCCLLVSPDPQRRFLPIDLFDGEYNHRFYRIADAEFALKNRRRLGDCVWTVPPGFGAALAVVKELLNQDTFKHDSREAVRHGAQEDPDGFLRGISKYLGEPLSRRLLSACEADRWEEVESLAPEIRRRILSQRLKRLPAGAVFLWKLLRLHLSPPMTMLVVLIGPDGAGKTTVAERICKRMFHNPFRVCSRFEFNFRIMPELKQIRSWLGSMIGRPFRISAAPPPGTKGSGMNKEHSTLGAMAYMLYYTLDFLAGRISLMRIGSQSGLVVFARYFHDYRYQKGYRNVPKWFFNILEALVPSPDLIIYLKRDANEIYAGKPELDVSEILFQQSVIQDFLANRCNGVVIDASQGVDATVERVEESIIKTLFKKTGTS
jgi:thymidylate kinase